MRYAIVCEPAPLPAGRINEDTYYFRETGSRVFMLVADGATPRMELRRFNEYLATLAGHSGTSARYAANLIREVAQGNPQLTPREVLLQANEKLRAALEQVYGALDADRIGVAEPQLREWLAKDVRFLRLALPAAVATVVRLNLESRTLEYAHAGDTGLFLIARDGHVSRVTSDRMNQHDNTALAIGQIARTERDVALAEVIHDPAVVILNQENALYHNFVAKDGTINREIGVGTVDGLELLDRYIEEGTESLDDVASVILMSDGAMMPALWDEVTDGEEDRLQLMGKLIRERGLLNYIDQVRTLEREDASLNRFPRFKIHDDATAIQVEPGP